MAGSERSFIIRPKVGVHGRLKMSNKRKAVLLKFALIALGVIIFIFYVSNSGVFGSQKFVISEEIRKNSSLKYILQWTYRHSDPFISMGVGQSEFIKRKCAYTNCFVTDDKSYLKSYTKFDAIIFAWPQLSSKKLSVLPEMRSSSQKYVFVSAESPIYYPLCNDFYNGYFNWTWTYKLDSDSRWRYVDVWDVNGTTIGPREDMQWMNVEDMDPVPDELKQILSKKSKAAAWFVSNCPAKSKREVFVKKLQNELLKYNLEVDIYGRCGPFVCPRSNPTECFKRLEEDYYFYLSFENSFAEDYVTEKLLTALQHNTVPIVYGGANYSRFLPDGIYLNARSLGVEKLAATMNRLIQNPAEYMEYFRWKNHYSYDSKFEGPATDNICAMCEILNDQRKVESVSIHSNIKEWWSVRGTC